VRTCSKSAWTRSPPGSRWQANQLPAHRRLLAAAQLEARGTEVFAQAGTTFETIRRTFVKIAVRVAELKGVIKDTSGHHSCGDDGRDHDAGPMIDATLAAVSPHFNHKTRSDCRRGGLCSARRARATTMVGGRGGGGALVSDWRPPAEAPGSCPCHKIILDATDGLSAS
jgi:hypothetical protein